MKRIGSQALAGQRMALPKPKPRKLVYCSFCGKEQAEVKKIIAGPGVQICESCVNVCKTIIDRELVADAFKPVGMTHAQFKVGQEFLTETGRWICTDKGKRTVILVAHRLSTVVHADAIHVMEAGRVIQSGAHDELVERPGLYRTLWNIQTGHAEMNETA